MSSPRPAAPGRAGALVGEDRGRAMPARHTGGLTVSH